jgi:hypothetical protein
MNYFDEVSTSYRQSIEIASNYLVRKGYPRARRSRPSAIARHLSPERWRTSATCGRK